MMRPTSPDPSHSPTPSDGGGEDNQSSVTDVALTLAILEGIVLVYLGLLFPVLLILEILNLFLAYLLFLWVRFTLADARRAFRWAAIAAAVCPCASYVLCLAAGLLGGDSSGGGFVGLIGTYAVASLAVVTKER
jgi:fatty acid desaturase